MADDPNSYHPAHKLGEASANIQPALEERLVDLRNQLLEANPAFSSAEISLVGPCEVNVSIITSEWSLNFPFRMLSQVIPHPIRSRGHLVSITSSTTYGIFDVSKNAYLIRYSIWVMT